MKLACALTVSLLCVFAAGSAKAIMPVIDMKAIIASIQNLHELKNLRNIAHGDMRSLQGDLNALNPLHFTSDSLRQHLWSASNWRSALSGEKGSSMISGMDNFKKNNQQIYQFTDHTSQKEEVNQALETNAVLDAESSKEYDRLGVYAEKVNALSNRVQSAASTKEALDINNKLLVELAYLEIETIHMQALQNQASAQQIHRGLASAAATDKFLGSIKGGQ